MTPVTIEISVVSAIYNEGEGVSGFVQALFAALEKVGVSFEVILVDDGSGDDSLEKMVALTAEHKELRVVELTRNHGQVKALGAGLAQARGNAVVMMDGDMQHNPEDILRFYDKRREGYDLVATFREKRADALRRKAVTWLGNRVNRFLTGIDIKDFGSSFRMIDAAILAALKDRDGYVHFSAPHLYLNAARIAHVPVIQHERAFGSTKWSFGQFVSYNLDFLASSPRLTTILIGLSFVGFAAGGLIYLANMAELFDDVRSMTAPVSIAFSSLQLAMLGVIWREVIIGQRLARGTPPYLIRKIWDGDASSTPRPDS